MPNKQLILIILLLSSFLTLTGCANPAGPVPENTRIAVICTSAVKPQSELIFFDEAGQQLGSLELKAQGIFKIEQANPATLVLPVMYSDQILTLKLAANQLETRTTKKYPLFYQQLGDRELIIFNSDENGDIDYLTYTLHKGTEEQSMRIKGFPLAMAAAETTAYIYLEKQTEADSILILDLADFRITQEIPLTSLNLEGVRDLKLIGNRLYIPAAVSNELVCIAPGPEVTFTSQRLDSPAPVQIFEHQGQLVVVHFTGGITLLEPATLQSVKNSHVPANILTAQLHDGLLYLLVKEADASRRILVFNLETARVERVLEIQHQPELLAQDFVVL